MDENLDLKVSDFGFSVKLNDGETLTGIVQELDLWVGVLCD